MLKESIIYLDHCGSTPLSTEVRATMAEFISGETFGNPSASHHVIGARAEILLNSARTDIARELGAEPHEVLFTSGATEANNLVLWGFALRYQGRNPAIFYAATEHKSVYETCQFLANVGLAHVQEIPVTRNGQVDLEWLDRALAGANEGPVLVAVMQTNNEIPVRNPIEDISRICRKFRASFHCDGVQGFVRENFDFSAGLCGSYVISPHKLYGPKGVGILLLGKTDIAPLIKPAYRGGDQESGLRPGTHNLLGIVASATAISSHNLRRAERLKHLRVCTGAFTTTLLGEACGVSLTIPLQPEAPGIVNFYAKDLDAPTLLESLSSVCISRGSSCIGSNGEKFSHVPRALGLPLEVQANVLRASFGDGATVDDSIMAAKRIAAAVKKLKGPH